TGVQTCALPIFRVGPVDVGRNDAGVIQSPCLGTGAAFLLQNPVFPVPLRDRVLTRHPGVAGGEDTGTFGLGDVTADGVHQGVAAVGGLPVLRLVGDQKRRQRTLDTGRRGRLDLELSCRGPVVLLLANVQAELVDDAAALVGVGPDVPHRVRRLVFVRR